MRYYSQFTPSPGEVSGGERRIVLQLSPPATVVEGRLLVLLVEIEAVTVNFLTPVGISFMFLLI